MKNLFSINKTNTDNAVCFDETPYLSTRVSEATRERLDHAFDILLEDPTPTELTDEQKALKKRSGILWISGGGAFIVALILFFGFGTEVHPVLTGVSFAAILAAVVLLFLARRVESKLHATHRDDLKQDFSAATEKLNAAAAEAARELGVPKGASALEILPYCYKMSNGTPVRVGKKNRFDNISTSAWVAEGHLCLATAQELYRIPLSSVRAVRTVDEDFEIDFWLKEEPPESETYAAYNIRSTGLSGKKSHGYLSVELSEDYEFLVPGYDRAILEGMLKTDGTN